MYLHLHENSLKLAKTPYFIHICLIYTHMYAAPYTQTHTLKYTCKPHTHAHIRSSMHTCPYIHTQTSFQTHMFTHTQTYMHLFRDTHAQKEIHLLAHTKTCIHFLIDTTTHYSLYTHRERERNTHK